MAVATVHPDVLLPPLAKLATVAIDTTGDHFEPQLPSTMAALATALAANPAHAVPLIQMATKAFIRFAEHADKAAAFSTLLDQVSGHVLPMLQASTATHAPLAAALLTLADRYARFLPEALVYSASLPSLIDLAATMLVSCRAANDVEAAIEFLTVIGRIARAAPVDEMRAGLALRMHEALGELGARLVQAAILSLADSLPSSLVPRSADWMASMLHIPSWTKPSDSNPATSNLFAWTVATLTAMPSSDGIPDNHSKEMLLRGLTTLPDPLKGGGIDLSATERLRGCLAEFARVCRRLPGTNSFDIAAYDWTPAA